MLKWTAVGKTYGEIGLILSIDQRTVKFHIVNAMRKAQLQQQGGGHHEGLRHRPAQLNRRLVA